MNTLIIYASKYGTTKRVAELIADEIKTADVISIKDISSVKLNDYGQIIIGAPVYAGSINTQLRNFINTNEKEFIDKRIGLFVCGMMPEGYKRQEEMKAAYPEFIQNLAIKYDFLDGAIQFDKMNFFEKAIIKKIMKISNNLDTTKPEKIRQFAQAFSSVTSQS